jgi:hypothetical protein
MAVTGPAATPRRVALLATAAVIPLAVVGLLAASHDLDVRWQNQLLENRGAEVQQLIGDETQRLLPPGAVVERLPELRVQGKAEPLTCSGACPNHPRSRNASGLWMKMRAAPASR